MCDGFIENIEVLDEWVSAEESFRLVYKGAGPLELQIFKDNVWRAETSCFEWGVITSRLLELKKKELNITAIDTK